MRRLITRGRFTQDYTKGLVIAPEDRREAVRRLVEAAGAHLREFYFTSGDCDFVIISEADDVERERSVWPEGGFGHAPHYPRVRPSSEEPPENLQPSVTARSPGYDGAAGVR